MTTQEVISQDNLARIRIHASVATDTAKYGRSASLLNAALGYDDSNLTLVDKLCRAVRAAKFEETPPHIWRKVLPSIPEGVSTTRANEMFLLGA